MKNKITLFFLAINVSITVTPIFAVWDDIFSWTKHRTFSVPVVNNILHENSEQKNVAVEKELKEEKKIQKNVAQNKIENKQNWDPKKVAVVVGVLALTCFFNLKAVLGMIVLTYLIRQNSEYINKSGAGKIIDGFVEKGIQTIKDVL